MRRVFFTVFWLALLSLFWPLLHTIIFYQRFNQMPPGGLIGSLFFLPMGAFSGALLLYLISRSVALRQRRLAIIGYVLASPFAFVGSLLFGLATSPLVSVALFGGGPLALGAWLGYIIGRPE